MALSPNCCAFTICRKSNAIYKYVQLFSTKGVGLSMYSTVWLLLHSVRTKKKRSVKAEFL